jgi:hypothetical protein
LTPLSSLIVDMAPFFTAPLGAFFAATDVFAAFVTFFTEESFVAAVGLVPTGAFARVLLFY